MSFVKSAIVAGFLSLAAAFTQPGSQTYGALLTPSLADPVTQGQSFQVTWDNTGHSTDGVTVSLVLCKGPGANCILQPSAIVEGVPAAQASYTWAVPCSLTPGIQSTDTGYGMLIIVDGTGEFQYSTQFSVNANPACSAGSTTSISSSASASASSSESVSTTITSASSSASGSISTQSSGSETSSVSYSSSVKTSATSNKSTTTASAQSSAGAASTMHTTTTGSAASTTRPSGSASSSVVPFTGGASQMTGGVMGCFAAGLFAILAL